MYDIDDNKNYNNNSNMIMTTSFMDYYKKYTVMQYVKFKNYKRTLIFCAHADRAHRTYTVIKIINEAEFCELVQFLVRNHEQFSILCNSKIHHFLYLIPAVLTVM